ncbi:hypothetical protein LXL04_010387 [Taraxacum kok-saghyz]
MMNHCGCSYFIFGDASVDNGNSNVLATVLKADYPPYGVDFPQGVTGRFTNGRTIPDFIGQLLGFDNFIPPYVNATNQNQEISTGVNYGSGAAGIRDETGKNLVTTSDFVFRQHLSNIFVGDRFSLNRQILNHAAIISRISLKQKNKTFTQEYLKKCIYVSIIGNDDYINNYLMPNNYPTSRIYTTDQYATVLSLYKLGARKIAVFGLGPIGCTPTEIARFGTDGKPCVDSINDAINLFNFKLKPLVNDLNKSFQDARFTFINVTVSPSATQTVGPCCQVREDGQCIPNAIPCPNRDLTVFFDGLHPTEITNMGIASRAYNAPSAMDASPYDINQLAQL